MRWMTGYIGEINGDEITLHLEDEHGVGIATIPRSLLNTTKQPTVRRGTWIVAEVDATELVVSARTSLVGEWTAEDISKAKADGADRAGRLSEV